MNHPSPHRYVLEGQSRGVDTTVLRHAASQIASTTNKGAGPILSLRHLAHLAGAPYLYLRQIVQRVVDPYDDILRPKRTGGMRAISAPEPVLMDVQRLILRRALRNVPMHSASYAYREGRSIIECAQVHVGARWMLKFDLHDFFGSVSDKQVYDIFAARGYSPLVSLELARLCTRARISKDERRRPTKYTAIPSYSVGVQGRLPQGGPASGALANAVATPLDEVLADLAGQAGFAYTRYSDDLVMSTNSTFDRAEATEMILQVDRLVSRAGFKLHRKKTRVIPPGARHIVLGLQVQQDRIRLTPEFRRGVEVHVRGVARFGLAAHATHRGFRSMLSFVSHVDGSLAFAAAVEPAWAQQTRDQWVQALRGSGYPVAGG